STRLIILFCICFISLSIVFCCKTNSKMQIIKSHILQSILTFQFLHQANNRASSFSTFAVEKSFFIGLCENSTQNNLSVRMKAAHKLAQVIYPLAHLMISNLHQFSASFSRAI